MKEKTSNKNKKAKKETPVKLSNKKYEKWLEEDNLLLLNAWARDGLSNQQIANNCGVTRKTFQEWLTRYSDIRTAIKKGKEVVDVEVENALLKRALGFKESVKKPMKVRNVYYYNGKREKEEEEIITVDEETYYPPDTTAQIFWLKNRKRGIWTNSDNPNFVPQVMEDDALTTAIKSMVGVAKDEPIEEVENMVIENEQDTID